MRNSWSRRSLQLAAALLFVATAWGQTVSPPVAEYRGKANGVYELRNDGDTPLAVILEVHGFTVDENGVLRYQDLDPGVNVELGSNSFVIPPHETHMVFYKAKAQSPQAWFTILNTLTRAASAPGQMRINFVLPHVVYLYQKQKLKKEDIAAKLVPAAEAGKFDLQIVNLSGKLGRVMSVSAQGFEKSAETGGFPIFPGKKRLIVLEGGSAKNDARVKISFEDGFSLQVPLS